MLAIVINLLKIHAMKIFIGLVLATTMFSYTNERASIAGRVLYPTPIDWQKTTNWKLYNIRSRDAFKYSLDSLSAFKSVPLAQDSMMLFLNKVAQIQEGNNPVWMGAYVATCQLADGSYIKMELSQYGSFFYVEKEQRYYQLSDNVRDSWPPYLTSKWLQVQAVN